MAVAVVADKRKRTSHCEEGLNLIYARVQQGQNEKAPEGDRAQSNAHVVQMLLNQGADMASYVDYGVYN